MLHLFLTPSPLLDAGEVLVGISLPMFVAALIAAFGDRFKQSVGRLHPRPETGVLALPIAFVERRNKAALPALATSKRADYAPQPQRETCPAFEPTLARGL